MIFKTSLATQKEFSINKKMHILHEKYLPLTNPLDIPCLLFMLLFSWLSSCTINTMFSTPAGDLRESVMRFLFSNSDTTNCHAISCYSCYHLLLCEEWHTILFSLLLVYATTAPQKWWSLMWHVTGRTSFVFILFEFEMSHANWWTNKTFCLIQFWLKIKRN